MKTCFHYSFSHTGDLIHADGKKCKRIWKDYLAVTIYQCYDCSQRNPEKSVDTLLELVAKLLYTKSLLKNQQNFYMLDKIKNVTYVRMLLTITTATKEFSERNLNTDVYALFGKKKS